MNTTTNATNATNDDLLIPMWNATAILDASYAPSVAPKPPTLETQLGVGTFVVLFLCVIASTFLAGTTVQWTLNKGLLEKKLLSKANQYNVLVSIAGVSSMIHTLLCFFNNIMYPDLAFGVAMSVVVNWVVMTNSSIMLVSQRLALTFQNPKLAWRRLLWINYIALPLCITIGTSWAISHNTTPKFPGLDKFVLIIEPVQIAVFGIVEFVLSGAFIVQMWKYRWTDVERHGMFMLFAVGALDMLSVLLNLMMGDLESTCVKGLVYSLRIRLEVNVLCCMVDYIKNRRGRVTYGSSGTTDGGGGAGGRASQRRASEFFRIKNHKRPSQKLSTNSSKQPQRFDSEMDRLRDELNSGASEISGAGTSHEQAPNKGHYRYQYKENNHHLGRSDVPIKIDNNTNFTVSQLRSSTGTDSPYQDMDNPYQDIDQLDHSAAMQAEDSDGESFTNDFFRQHFLEAKRIEEEEALKKKLETRANTKANERKILNDTDSTTRMTNQVSTELSTSFHDDDGNEDNPFHDLEQQSRSMPSHINHSDKTLTMNNSSNRNSSNHNCSAPFSVVVDTSEADAMHISRSSHSNNNSNNNNNERRRSSLESVSENYEPYPNDEPESESGHDDDYQKQRPYERRYSSSTSSSHHERARYDDSSSASSRRQRSYDGSSQGEDYSYNNHHNAGSYEERDLESQSQSSDSSMQPLPRHSYQQHNDAESAEFFDCVHSTSELVDAPYTYAPNTVVIDSSPGLPPQRITIKNKSSKSSSRRSIT